MGFWNNVRSDLALRNLTIYAQWLSVLAAILLYLQAVFSILYRFGFFLSSQNRLESLFFGVMAFVFPLAPLALDLPQYVQQDPWLYVSMASSFAIPVRQIIFVIANGPTQSDSPFELLVPFLVFAGSFLFVFATWTMPFNGPRTRVGVNVLYCGHRLFILYILYIFRLAGFPVVHNWYMWCQSWGDMITAGMFGVAALLYSIAWIRRHTWIQSKSLGGTGIEPMVLMLPGRGPLYQSVGNEAGQGAIRLV